MEESQKWQIRILVVDRLLDKDKNPPEVIGNIYTQHKENYQMIFFPKRENIGFSKIIFSEYEFVNILEKLFSFQKAEALLKFKKPDPYYSIDIEGGEEEYIYSILGTAAINGVRRAALMDSAAIARCTTRKSVHQ